MTDERRELYIYGYRVTIEPSTQFPGDFRVDIPDLPMVGIPENLPEYISERHMWSLGRTHEECIRTATEMIQTYAKP